MQLSQLVPILLVLVIPAFVAAMLLLAVFFLRRRLNYARSGDDWPYFAKNPLTPPEQVLYWRLVKALPNHIVLAQVGCSRVLGVKPVRDQRGWFNRISQLSYDFVICKKDGSVVAAIELDDKTHESAKRAETDAKKQRATEAAGVRLVRWSVGKMPDEAMIRSLA